VCNKDCTQLEQGVWLNFLTRLFSACIGFYIAPTGRRFVATGGAMPLFGVAQPVGIGFSYSFAPAGQRSSPTAAAPPPPLGAGLSYDRFHGLRFAGFAGCAPPVATILRPIRGEKHQANNNGKKVVHRAMNFNHTPCKSECRNLPLHSLSTLGLRRCSLLRISSFWFRHSSFAAS
jgi:hypothetical protein